MNRAPDLVALARRKDALIATAESCTGGMIAAALTDIAGSSDVVDRGFITYSNAAKSDVLAVPEATIAAVGAVSEEVARAMAEGALARSGAARAVAVTGIAGPGGGSPEKPEGLVWFALARRGQPTLAFSRRFGAIGRARVRAATVETALTACLEAALCG